MTDAATFAVAKVTQLMMHEECGAAQNYVVADAGEALICRPLPVPGVVVSSA
jgi:hypothetical protein